MKRLAMFGLLGVLALGSQVSVASTKEAGRSTRSESKAGKSRTYDSKKEIEFRRELEEDKQQYELKQIKLKEQYNRKQHAVNDRYSKRESQAGLQQELDKLREQYEHDQEALRERYGRQKYRKMQKWSKEHDAISLTALY